MAADNVVWGAPKIHGELLKLGFVVSERTVGRYLRYVRRLGDPAKRWLAFLNNHREATVAFDFFTVPTVTFQLLYCFFVIEHGRRRILHFNVTSKPTSEGVLQQLREAFPESGPCYYVIFDRERQIRCRCDSVSGIHRADAEAHQHPFAVAKRGCGALDWKLPPGVARSCDRSE